MNIDKAMIIKTSGFDQTELVQKLRKIRAIGNDVVLVPHGVTDLFITIEEKNNDEVELIVSLQKTDKGWDPVDLDIARGFNSVAECWEYAMVVIKEAGLPEDSCDSDVWEEPKEGVVL
jgi:hypothetical protein